MADMATVIPPHRITLRWERGNKAFHEALIAGFNSTWSKYLLSILYRHAERYRNINFRLTPAHA